MSRMAKATTDQERIQMLREFLQEMADGYVPPGEWPSMPMERIVDVLRATDPEGESE